MQSTKSSIKEINYRLKIIIASLLSCEFIQLLLRLDPRFYLFDHGVELSLALFVGLGVDVVGFALALCVGGRIASLVEMIVQLVDTAGSRSAVFSFIGLERLRPLSLFGLGELCFMLFERVARADTALDLLRCFLLHLARDVAVGVERGRDRGMADDHRHRFDVHAVLEGVGGEGVPLRYNNDKRKKASIQGVFLRLSLFFNSFSKVDYRRANCREKEAVKVMTKKGHFIL